MSTPSIFPPVQTSATPVGTNPDVRSKEAVLKAGALQNAILNSANFSSIATDEMGVIQIFNVGAERMLGYAASDVLNKITPADISDSKEVIARAKALSLELATEILPGFEALVFKASRGIEDIYELTYIRKDGSRFPAIVSVTALRDSEGAIIGYLLIGTDNTARKQVEEEQKKLDQRLRDQQFYTRSLIESNIDAIMTTDPLGIISDVNKQMEALTGCTRDELIGAPFKNYFTDPERAEAAIKLVLSEKKVTDYELTARSRDGKETVVSYNATTFYDRDRKLQGVFAAARDVTERKRFERALQESNVELESAKFLAERASLAKSDFLSSMSHELRSPLNAILGFAQLMESAIPAPTKGQAERITQILQAGWHLLKLINEILDLAAIESGQVSLSKESVSLPGVMAECQSMMEPLAHQRGIVMTFPHFDDPVFVKADLTRLKQIVINLLSNAIKYNRERGTVVVDCTSSNAGTIRISVKDTGLGLPPTKLAQLFQPFNRLGQEAGTVTGTGIGLVVTQRLAKLMGGVLGVESIVGKGSVFWCELTAAAAPQLNITYDKIEGPLELSPAPSTSPRSLIYVEDNPANMELVKQLVARRGDIQMSTAVNGTLGIELTRAIQPTVVLMDINLPGISGVKALKLLKEDPATAHIPIVAISANAMPHDISRGMAAGFFSYLTKPIKVKEFMEALDAALEFAGKILPPQRILGNDMITAADIFKGRILVVDDQPANVALLVQMLQASGYVSIVSTTNSREVCALHQRHPFDLILLDLQMPNLDGFQVMDKLKEMGTVSYPAVLVITAQPDHKLRALKGGAKDFISKPFSLPEVLARVYNMLEIRLLHRSEIRSSHKRLENSQRIAGLGDWELNFSSQRLVWSEEVYRILGVPRTDLPLDKNAFDQLVHADDRNFIQREKKAAANASRRAEFEHRIVRPDGKIRHLHHITEMSYDEQGQPAIESGIVQDITARWLADDALRQSEERYRLMFDLNPSPMWVYDRVTLTFLAANQAAVVLYGYAIGELLQLSVSDVHATEHVQTSLTVEPALHGECCRQGRCYHRKKDGSVFPVEVSSHPIDFLGRSAWLVMTTDKTEAEAAVAALRLSEARFRALSDSAPLGIFECDAEGFAIYLNPTLIALSGRTMAENLGRGWEKNIRSDHRAATSAQWLRTISEGGTWDQEQCMIRPDGSERWVHTLAAPSRDATGRVTGFVGTVEDITDRRITATAIRESEERYRKLMMLSPDAEFVHVDGTITLVNRAFCLLMGAADPAQLLGKSALDIVHVNYHPLVRARREMHANDQPIPPSEMKIVRLDGTTVDVEVNATAFDFLGRKEVQVIARDITARTEAARALKESEERFKFVTRAVSDVVWDWDLVSNALWWNEGYLTKFGHDAAAISPGIESWIDHIHPKERERVVKSIRHAIDNGMESWSEEYRFERKNGTYAFVQDRGYILRNAENKGIRMVGGMRDLTEQKEAEAQSFRAQRMESIGTLAGGIAHDLNNVLTPIMMCIELLQSDPGQDPSRTKLLDTVAISCRRGADLVRQVLSFAGGRDGERRLVRVRHVIDDLNGMISETFPRNIQITTQIPIELWDVSADPTQLHQVLLNLAVNARDAMPGGGTLTISTSNVTGGPQSMGTSSEPKTVPYVLLEVTDTGTGIPPEVRDKIFEPFFTTKVMGSGTGLGLATVHTIVKSHGGLLKVESEMGRGTTFKIYLPAVMTPASKGTVPPFAIKPPRGRNELVLVVDDESAIRHITQQTLEASGYRVITAKDGADAVNIYSRKSEEIAVVLTDMMMPIMNGAVMARALRRVNSRVKIIAVSGLEIAGNKAPSSDPEVADFLTKPYTSQTLLQLVREVLDRTDKAFTDRPTAKGDQRLL